MSTEASGWKEFARRHWGAIVVFVLAAAAAFAWGVYVFLWFVGNAQSSGMVPATLGLWTMANLVTFVVYLVLWELLLVGVPAAIAALVGWIWWRRLPFEERAGYHAGGRSRSARNGGGVSLLFFIAFCVKVYLDGKWNAPIASYTLNYVVGSMIVILEWGLVVIGIPVAVALVWWVHHEMRKA
jgi:hypothetical protein